MCTTERRNLNQPSYYNTNNLRFFPFSGHSHSLLFKCLEQPIKLISLWSDDPTEISVAVHLFFWGRFTQNHKCELNVETEVQFSRFWKSLSLYSLEIIIKIKQTFFSLIMAEKNVWSWTKIGDNPTCAVLWSLYFTFITRDERFGHALKGGRNDGAVSMWKNVLWVVKDIFPAVGTGLQQRDGDGKQDQTHVHTVNKTKQNKKGSGSRQTLLERADSKNPLPCSAGATVSLRLSSDYRPQKGSSVACGLSTSTGASTVNTERENF